MINKGFLIDSPSAGSGVTTRILTGIFKRCQAEPVEAIITERDKVMKLFYF